MSKNDLPLKNLSREHYALKNQIKDYKMKPDHSEEYLARLIRMERAIADFIKHSQQIEASLHHTEELLKDAKATPTDTEFLQIIKKQALIIRAANVQWPTINDSIQLIADCVAVTENNYHAIGGKIPQLTIGGVTV